MLLESVFCPSVTAAALSAAVPRVQGRLDEEDRDETTDWRAGDMEPPVGPPKHRFCSKARGLRSAATLRVLASMMTLVS